MALPGDVTTFDLHFGDDVEGYTDVTGAVTLLGAEGIVYPIDLATGKRLNLVHVATGQAILPADVEFTLDDGGKAKAIVSDLPHTDNASLSVVGFGYQVEWKLASGPRHVTPGKKRFAVPTAAGASVDYDLLDVAEAVPGVLVPMGVSSGVADAALAALLPGPSLTATALDARYLNEGSGAGGALSGTYPNPGLNTTAVDALVAATVADDDSDTSLALDTYYVQRGPILANMASPLIMAHSAASMLYPENTIEAARAAAALPGVDVLDLGDFQVTSDGAAVAVHDSTLDAKTTLSGNVSDFSLGALRRAAVVDASSWFGGGWPDLYMPTADMILAEFGNSRVLSVEPKSLAAAARLADIVSARGLGPSVLWIGSAEDLAIAGIPAGAIPCVYRTVAQVAGVNAATYAASLLALDIHDISVQHGSDLTKIQAFIDAGLNVWVYDIFRHYEFATYAGMDLRGYTLDDPLYTPGNPATYRKTAVSWPKTGTWGPGHMDKFNNRLAVTRGSFVGTAGAYRWQPISDEYCLVGELSPVASPGGTYTITVPITVDALGGDLTRWAGFFFAQATDLAYADGQAHASRNGYNLLLRANGDVQLYSIAAGTGTQIGISVMPDLTAGATVTLTIAVTPTTIGVTRSDGGPAINVTNSAARGGYMFAGANGYSAGSRVSFGAITIT